MKNGPEKNEITAAIDKCIHWITTQMSSFDHAAWGIYERIRIDINQRVCWVRPDCNAEYLNVLDLHDRKNGRCREPYYSNIFQWMKKVQNMEDTEKKGSYNFYFLDGVYQDGAAYALFQNDNGKILYNLGELYERTGDNAILSILTPLADFWIKHQTDEGYFCNPHIANMHCLSKGPCFVVWMMMGLYKIWKITGDASYYTAANKALCYCLDTLIHENGIHTSYELEKFEDWRPYSSEVSILLFGLSEAYVSEVNDSLRNRIDHQRRMISDLIMQMQHKSGAILNQGNDSIEGLTLQACGTIADLVYTQGFALRALVRAYEVFGESEYLESAKRLAQFLISIQCAGESPYWDGAWRGSYDVDSGCWAGRCNQNNQIDEGGMYSVYTGWCCTNIMLGLLNLEKHI